MYVGFPRKKDGEVLKGHQLRSLVQRQGDRWRASFDNRMYPELMMLHSEEDQASLEK